MKTKIYEMQQELKALAQSIKANKPHTYNDSINARHLHMVYGVLRGVPMSAIEAKCRTPICNYYLSKIVTKYNLTEEEINCDEIICYSRSVLIS